MPRKHEVAWRQWLRAHALLERKLDGDLRTEHGLNLLTYDALVQLSEAPERRLHMKDLAEALVYSTSGLTRIVDNLERSGFARREVDPNNRRATLVVLTDEGFATLEAAWRTHARGVRDHFTRHATVAQVTAIADVFRKVVNDLEPPRS